MAIVNKERHIGIDLEDENEMLVSNLGNRGKYLTYKECLLIEKKIMKSKRFALTNDVDKLNNEYLKERLNER